MIGVNGWFSANQASGPGSDSVGTKALLRNTRINRSIGRLLAVSTLCVTRPRATHSQVTASAVRMTRPIAAIHSAGPVVGRNPMRTATAVTMATAISAWTRLPPT